MTLSNMQNEANSLFVTTVDWTSVYNRFSAQNSSEIEANSPATPRLSPLPQEQIAALHQRFHFPIRDAALVHPESAVGMHPSDATRADDLRRLLDALGDFFGRLHRVHLD